jgi:GTP1/Obg family GTP-binding protein
VVLHKAVGRKFKNNGIQDGGAAILKFTKTWITSEPSVRFWQNFMRRFLLQHCIQRYASKWHFWKSKMAADEMTNFIKTWITKKRLVQSAPNLAQTTMAGIGRMSSLAAKIGNQLPVLCACAIKIHV